MDHQVEDNIDVGASPGEHAETVRFDETGLADPWQHRLQRRIEALGVADQQQPARTRRLVRHGARLGESGGHRFLDEHRQPAIEAAGHGGRMVDGRHRDGHRIEVRREVAKIGERGDSVTRRHGAGPVGIPVDDGDEHRSLDPREDPGMMLAETSDADHADPHRISARPAIAHHGQRITPRSLRWMKSRSARTSGCDPISSSTCAQAAARFRRERKRTR